MPRATAPAPAATAQSSFQPASQNDIVEIGNSVDSQNRFDGRAIAEVLGGAFGAAVGAAGGTLAATLGSAAFGLTGWGLAGAGIAGLVAGGAIGAHLGSNFAQS